MSEVRTSATPASQIRRPLTSSASAGAAYRPLAGLHEIAWGSRFRLERRSNRGDGDKAVRSHTPGLECDASPLDQQNLGAVLLDAAAGICGVHNNDWEKSFIRNEQLCKPANKPQILRIQASRKTFSQHLFPSPVATMPGPLRAAPPL